MGNPENEDTFYDGKYIKTSLKDLVWAIPVKVTYLLFSPFPWDIKTPAHLIGLIDGLLYLGHIIIIFRKLVRALILEKEQN